MNDEINLLQDRETALVFLKKVPQGKKDFLRKNGCAIFWPPELDEKLEKPKRLLYLVKSGVDDV